MDWVEPYYALRCAPQRCRTTLPWLPILPARTETRPGVAGGNDAATLSPPRVGTLTVGPGDIINLTSYTAAFLFRWHKVFIRECLPCLPE